MYNRYIPQQDGSYRRNTVAQQRPSPPKPPPPPPPPSPSPEPMVYCPNPHRQTSSREKGFERGISGFLQHLLPRDFDTGDLIVVLLLLLMAGDSEENRNNAILTIALYFIM